MYLDHFGLREPPFSITPHTELFFSGANRGAMLDALNYAITNDEGIIKVTGEVGSGKTMLCRMLLEKLPKHVETVYLATPSLSREDILHAIAEELGLKLTEYRTHQLMRSLQEHLLEIHATGRRVVVLIDEAHAMPTETLEEIRLLSNLETNRHKLLHIVLFGQPELDERLDQQDMRQLKDRVTHNFKLEPLHRNDIGNYLMFRLRAAGYRGPDLFTADALQCIYRASQGLTRRINILADKALLAAFSEEQHLISGRLAKIAIRDSQFAPMQNYAKHNFAWAAGAAILILLGAGWWALSKGMIPDIFPKSAKPTESTLQHPAGEDISHPGKEAPAFLPEKTDTEPKIPTLGERISLADEWLQNTPDTHYCIQLFSAENTDDDGLEIELFLRNLAADLDPRQIHVHRSEIDGNRRFDVIYGDYPNIEMAETEMARLRKTDIAGEPRIRTVGEFKAGHAE